MFVHTHPIGASYFSTLDMNTLESFAGLVSPMNMAMQVVTEKQIITRIGWMESNDDFAIRKLQDKSVLRKFFFKEIESQIIYYKNMTLYDEIRRRTYQTKKESFLRRTFHFRKTNQNEDIRKTENSLYLAERMKRRGFLSKNDFKKDTI
jgi:hypothetical protein